MSQEQQTQEQQNKEHAKFIHSHKCPACQCDKRQFYDRGIVFKLKDEHSPMITYEYHMYTCAGCSHGMLSEQVIAGPPVQHRSTS